MGRDSSCWEAVGKAREMFILIAADIKVYLEKHSDPVPYPVTWTIYMIGRTRETSEPMIMFCCRDSCSRKQVRKTVEESGILDQYQKVRVGDASRPPDFDQLVQLAGENLESISLGLFNPNTNPESIQVSKESEYANRFAYAEQAGVFFGKPIAVPIHDKEGIVSSVRRATAGGVLRSGKRCFYLTAGHVFEAVVDDSITHQAEDDSFEFDIGEGSDPDDDSEFIETTSKGSITPDLDESDSSEAMTVSIGDESALRPDRPFAEGNLEKGREDFPVSVEAASDSENPNTKLPDDRKIPIGCRLDPRSSKELDHSSPDYALIEMYPRFGDFELTALETHPDSPLLHPHEVTVRPRDCNVLAVTGSSGLLKGIMSGTPSYTTMPGSKRIQELWTARFEGNLSNGDCGSWVINAQNGDLVGHIVAGSPKSGVGYIVPAYLILEDAKTTFGLDLELYPTAGLTVANESAPVKTIPTSTLDIPTNLIMKGQTRKPVYYAPSASASPHTCEPSFPTGAAESSPQMISTEVVNHQINLNNEFLERRKLSRLMFRLSLAYEPLWRNLSVLDVSPNPSGTEQESKQGGLSIQKGTIAMANPLKSVTTAENGGIASLDSIAEDGPSVTETETHPAVDSTGSPNSQESDRESLSVVNIASTSIDQSDCNNSEVPDTNESTVYRRGGGGGGSFYQAYLQSLCQRRGWRDPLYETYRVSSGFTCYVLVNGRGYQTDLAYESEGLAQNNAAMRAFMVCRNFSVNGAMLARTGVVQGLPANESSGRHRRRGRRRGYCSSAASASSAYTSSSSSTTTSEE